MISFVTGARACAVALLFASPAAAQVAPASATVAPAVATLRAGTSVPLRLLTELTTNGKKLNVGHRFNLETSEPVSLNGQTVIPVGTPAIGEVTSVRNKGMWGKSGAITARLLHLNIDGRTIRLSGQVDDKGTTGTAGVVGAAVVLPVVGFFVTGTSAVIPAGTQVRGFTEEDTPVVLGPAVAPLTVPVAAPALSTR